MMRRDHRKSLILVSGMVVALLALSASSIYAKPVLLSDDELTAFVGGACCCHCVFYHEEPCTCGDSCTIYNNPCSMYGNCTCPYGTIMPCVAYNSVCEYAGYGNIGECLNNPYYKHYYAFDHCGDPTCEGDCVSEEDPPNDCYEQYCSVGISSAGFWVECCDLFPACCHN